MPGAQTLRTFEDVTLVVSRTRLIEPVPPFAIANRFAIFAQARPCIFPGHSITVRLFLENRSGIFTSSTERTAWNIAARHLAGGQKDPVAMIIEGIEDERRRCIELLQAATGNGEIPRFLADPDHEW